MSGRVVAIAGASGVIGAAAVEAFSCAGWDVIALSRRAPVVGQGIAFHHVPIDLSDRAACTEAVRAMGTVSHLVYAAVAEAPGLAPGWSDPDLIAKNRAMFANLAEPLCEAGSLAWAGLLQGTKAYGAHLHPISLPARENSPRDLHANFYFEQEDCLRDLATRYGLEWTIFRPQIVFGGAPGAAMNPIAAIGVYAALCREMSRPFAYPGTVAMIWEVADADLIASALLWAIDAPQAAAQIFNLTNGDVFVLKHDWDSIADSLGLDGSGAVAETLAEFFSSESAQHCWRHIAQREGLVVRELDELLGQSHHYVDMLLDERITRATGLPILVSDVKVRKAGFTDFRDSLDSFMSWLLRMVEMKILPVSGTAPKPVGR